MKYYIIPVTSFSQNCLVIWDGKHRNQASIVDPGGDAELITSTLIKYKLSPIQILLTHGHIDHVGAAATLAAYYKIPIIGPHYLDSFWLNNLPNQSRIFTLPKCEPFIPDRWLKDGEQIKIGNIALNVLHCPGHTPGHIVFFDSLNRLLISGDVIFNKGVGRTDLPRCNYSDLIRSIKNKLIPLGDDITFIPGHGNASTLGYERRNNSFLKE